MATRTIKTVGTFKQVGTACLVTLVGLGLGARLESEVRSEPGLQPPRDLKVESLANPMGLDSERPRFSWVLRDKRRGAAQTAYQIVVSRDEAEARRGTGSNWDTGKVKSAETINVPYGGQALESGETYYWSVRTWDGDGAARPWSEVHSFQMGLLDPLDWRAGWIAHPDAAVVSPLLRREFSVDKEIVSAYLYVTGVGYYEAYLNGEKVGDHVLDPAITEYGHRVLYETYDVKSLLENGTNAMGLWLGEGAWRYEERDDRYGWRQHRDYGKPLGIAQLDLRFADGSTTLVTTDASWTTDASPMTYNHLYGGEDYDARREQKGWSTAAFDDAGWQQAEVVEGPDVTLDSQLMPPIRVTQTLEPVVRTRPGPGTFLFDLGQNMPGWWQVRVEGDPGTRLTIRGAETLNDSLFPAPLEEGDVLGTINEYHQKVWSSYVLRGGGVESYEPRFFYTGLRYVEVKTEPPEGLRSLEVRGRVVHTDVQRNGRFSSSDELLNDIYEAAIWSQRGNLHGYPTDCPHREKGAYAGDGQVVAETSMHDFHMQPLYRKWIEDMRDSQLENGRIPNTAPPIVGGVGGGIAWGSAYVLIPWWMYQYHGDEALLAEHYPSMQRYLEYLRNLAASEDEDPDEEYIINEFGGHWDSLGEWEAPVLERNGPVNPLTNTYYWYLDSLTIARIAGVLGEEQDRAEYLALAESIKQAFNEKFFDPEANLYGIDTPYQTYLLFVLSGDLVPEGHRQAVLDNLVEDIMVTRDGHLGTGILGTKHLFKTLADEGREDVLHRIVTRRTFPSWGYWLENGATTLWEDWKGEASHNHQMFASVNEYFYKYLAGIRAPSDEGTSETYKEILIRPYVPEDLEQAEASVETVRGTVSSRWERNDSDGGLTLAVTIPPNTSGTVDIPDLGHEDVVVSEGKNVVWDAGGAQDHDHVTGGTRREGYVSFDLGAGSYAFSLSPADPGPVTEAPPSPGRLR
jgi:alpha-L-rhamnosidase